MEPLTTYWARGEKPADRQMERLKSLCKSTGRLSQPGAAACLAGCIARSLHKLRGHSSISAAVLEGPGSAIRPTVGMAAPPEDLGMSQILNDSGSSHGVASEFLYEVVPPAPGAPNSAARSLADGGKARGGLQQPGAGAAALSSSVSSAKGTRPPAAPRIQMGRQPRAVKKDRGPPPVVVRGETPTTARSIAAFNAQLDAILNSPGQTSPLRAVSGERGAAQSPPRMQPLSTPPRAVAPAGAARRALETAETPLHRVASGRPRPTAYGAGVLVTPTTAAVLGGLPADAELFFGDKARRLLQRSLGLHGGAPETDDAEEDAGGLAPVLAADGGGSVACQEEFEDGAEGRTDEGGEGEEPASAVDAWAVQIAGGGGGAVQALDASLTDALIARALAARDAGRAGSGGAVALPAVSAAAREHHQPAPPAEVASQPPPQQTRPVALPVSSSSSGADAAKAAQTPGPAAAVAPTLAAPPDSAASSTAAGTPLSTWLSDDFDETAGGPREGGCAAAAGSAQPRSASVSREDWSSAVTPAVRRGPLSLAGTVGGGTAARGRFVGLAEAPSTGAAERRGAGEAVASSPPGLLGWGGEEQAGADSRTPLAAGLGESAATATALRPSAAPFDGAAADTPDGPLPQLQGAVGSAGSSDLRRLLRDPSPALTGERAAGAGTGSALLSTSDGSHVRHRSTLHLHDLTSRSARLGSGSSAQQPRRLGVSFADSSSGGDLVADPAVASARRALLLSRLGGAAPPLEVLEEGGAVDEHDGTISDSEAARAAGGDAAAGAAAPAPPKDGGDDFVAGAAAAAVLQAAHAEWADDQRFVIRAQQLLSGGGGGGSGAAGGKQPQPAASHAPGAPLFESAVSTGSGSLGASSLSGSMAGFTASAVGAASSGYTPFFAQRSEPIGALGQSGTASRGRPLEFSPSPEAPPASSPDRDADATRDVVQAAAAAIPVPAAPRGDDAPAEAAINAPKPEGAPVNPSSAASTPPADEGAPQPSEPPVSALPRPPVAPPAASPAAAAAASALQVPRSMASLFLRAPLPVVVAMTLEAEEGAGAGSASVRLTPVGIPAPPAASGGQPSAVRLPLRNAGGRALSVHASFAKVAGTLECPGHGLAPVTLDITAMQPLPPAEAAADDARWALSPPLVADPSAFSVAPGGVAASVVQVSSPPPCGRSLVFLQAPL